MSEPGNVPLEAAGRRHGPSAEVVVTAKIPPNTHIEPHRPADPLLIPTVVEVEGLEDPIVDYPEPVRKELGFSDAALEVYEGTVRFRIRGEAPAGVEVVRGAVSYQPCVGGACLPPRGSHFEAKLVRPARAGRAGDAIAAEPQASSEKTSNPGRAPAARDGSPTEKGV